MTYSHCRPNSNADSLHPDSLGVPLCCLHAHHSDGTSLVERLELPFDVLSGLALLASFLHFTDTFEFAWIAVVLCGYPIFLDALRSAARLKINVEILIATAITATIFAHFGFPADAHEHSYLFAGGEVAFIMSIGHWLEERTVAKARAGIEGLIELTPQTARRIDGNNKSETIIPASEVQISDKIRVLPGETIPVDGVILHGNTSIDQSVLTGETLPVDKTEGDSVFSGTINRFGSFVMQAEKTGQDSSLARMIQLLEEAEEKKSPSERIADRWAAILVQIALLTAVLVAAASWYVLGDIEESLKRGITILVVFCPCSLVLAAPTAVIAAIGNISRHGILVRNGAALEQLGNVEIICFDKTGTLTHGQPQLVSISDSGLLVTIASIEKHSGHPLAQCIVQAAEKQNLNIPYSTDFQLFEGVGVSAEIDGQRIYAGNAALMERLNVENIEEVERQAEECFARGETVIYCCKDGVNYSRVIGFISLADTARESAKDVVSSLHDKKITPILLTGDHWQAARYIASQIGILDVSVKANLLPQDKIDWILTFQEGYGCVTAMVGDGLNDAPALKTADIGIAMGKIGSDLAIDAADIVLVGDDISRLPFLIELARKTKQTIVNNIVLSMTINAVAVALAATGVMEPALGALIHNAGSCFVIFNASLLLRLKEKK